jgi:protein-tyrosine phosphatase
MAVDFNFVTPRLATGAAISTVQDVAALVAAGITHVIDCRDDFDDGVLLAANRKLAYIYNPTPDDGKTKPPDWFNRSLTFALPALALPKNKVYAHCHAGVNRGPSTAYCIMRALGFSSNDAKHLIHSARPMTIAGIRYAGDADHAVVVLGYD